MNPLKLSKTSETFTTWKPESGFLFLLPTRLPAKKGSIILPESYTLKNDSGICFLTNAKFGDESHLDKECIFPAHTEYRVLDSDTGYLIYVVPSDKIIMMRIPPPEILAVSREKGSDAPKFETIEHSKKN